MRRWLFALAYDPVLRGYEGHVAARKRALIGGLRGTVLEIGPGTGANLIHLDPSVRWIGVEPNVHMRERLARAARRLGFEPEFREPHGNRLPAEDASVDAVLSTLVLCSVPDPAALMTEILRVLRPGGRFVFLEHVAAPRGTRLRRWQERLRAPWAWVADGCRLDRELDVTIRAAGFRSVELEEFHVPSPPGMPLIARQIAGTATR